MLSLITSGVHTNCRSGFPRHFGIGLLATWIGRHYFGESFTCGRVLLIRMIPTSSAYNSLLTWRVLESRARSTKVFSVRQPLATCDVPGTWYHTILLYSYRASREESCHVQLLTHQSSSPTGCCLCCATTEAWTWLSLPYAWIAIRVIVSRLCGYGIRIRAPRRQARVYLA